MAVYEEKNTVRKYWNLSGGFIKALLLNYLQAAPEQELSQPYQLRAAGTVSFP